MNFTEIILSYPYIKYRAEVSHFTSRKSTAIEWVILEAINKCEKLPEYSGISIANFFEQLFTISDADLLIRPVLISLQDIGAIIIYGIDDDTELNTVAMSNLRLTPTGREMQSQGLLPGVSSQEIFSIYYDLVEGVLKEETNLYKTKSTGTPIIDNLNEYKFPEGTIREWFSKIQNNKKQSKFNWLTPTTKIETIYPLDSELYWKNVTRKVELVDGMRWKISDIEDLNIDEVSLKKFNVLNLDELENLPYLEIKNPDEEIKKLVSFNEISKLVEDLLEKEDLFCVEAKYYKDVKVKQPNRKNIRIGIVFGANKFEVKNSKMQIIIYIPDYDLNNQGLFFNTSNSVKACITTVSAGEVSKNIPIAYIPREYKNNLPNTIANTVAKYYTQDNIILFALYELGLKDLFLEYVTNIVSENKELDDKAKIIESFNQKSKEFYGKNVILATDKENFLIDKDYIIKHSKNIENAKKIINDYAEINAFKQDDTLFQKMMQIVIKHVGVQDSLEDIWSFWKIIASAKKAHINWITKMELHKYLYSEKSILNFFNRFKEENLFEIDEYTIVEKTILNLKRISLQIKKLIPELNLYKTVSNEKYNEIVLAHKDILKDLYEKVRQWKKDEEEFINKVFNLDEFLKTDNPFMNVKKNIDALRNALANDIETMNLKSYLSIKQDEKATNKDGKKKNKKKKK